LGEVLGKGYFGEVRRASWKGIDVAVKYIYRSMSHDRETKMFYKEISILRFSTVAKCIIYSY